MAENGMRSLNHFSLFRFRERYWGLSPEERAERLQAWSRSLAQAAPALHLYQVFPAAATGDLLLWAATPLETEGTTADFLSGLACALNPFRDILEPVETLWGYTGRSVYSRARSAQEMDPFAPERRRYLVVYPFVKTTDWYLLSADARQGMMNEHIRLGKQYPQITQLLLYSFGLQDQEFVVVYETDDLALFSDLVREMRATEVRRYTRRDTPIYTGVHHPMEAAVSLWGAG